MPIPIIASGLKLAGPWLLSKLGGLFGKKKTPEPVRAPLVPPPAAPGIPIYVWIGGGVLLVLIIIIIVVVAGGKR